MTLDRKFFVTKTIQEYFVDKDTGLPLVAGTLKFYKDSDRSEAGKKPVFALTGSPPDYSYIELTNPLILSAVGTIQDNSGNCIPIYYYPYDAEGNIELYFVEIRNSSGVLQETRQAWPNVFSDASSTVQDLINYIPNGQFVEHNFIPTTPPQQVGQITQPITTIAAGGWTFERPTSSSALDIVTFQRIGDSQQEISANPRYLLRIKNEIPGVGDTFKDIRIKFKDVNKFASDTQVYTVYFEGASEVTEQIPVQLFLIKNYGVDGSPVTETQIDSFILTNVNTKFQTSFSFGINNLESIGPNDDDFIQLAFRLPQSTTYDIHVVNFLLTPNLVTITQFPEQTTADALTRTVAGWMNTPLYISYNLYLPLVLTQQGMQFDLSNIGKIYASSNSTAKIGELVCDGARYETSTYSADGIPYARLFNEALFNINQGNNVPIYGTGANYSIVFPYNTTSIDNNIRLSNNDPAESTATADGSTPTNFTFNTISLGLSSSFSLQNSFLIAPRVFVMVGNFYGAVTAPTVGTLAGTAFIIARNLSETRAIIEVVLPTVAASFAGQYFTFSSAISQDGPMQNFYVWYTVDGAGADPAPGGKGIQVNLFSPLDNVISASQTADAISGYLQSKIGCIAATSITPGSFFTFNAVSQGYYVFYKVDNVGTDPAVVSRIGIEVSVLGTDTNAQVAAKTQIAINSKYYAVPDLRGMHLIGQNFSATQNGGGNVIDAYSPFRYARNMLLTGGQVGSQYYDQVVSHTHTTTIAQAEFAELITAAGTNFLVDGVANPAAITGPAGSIQNSVLSTVVNWVIKY